ncbi:MULTISPECIES: acetylglutamate kinase [Flavobacterium]|uniref:acetylglutamate kinase n=1 Tax=Flavobacterium TaxID=237 RepID=UPI001FCBE1F0|nr:MULTISPECIES: acetylglutamate kinase [Flavobacterium]UOK42051.1 acetylglutamate kinase [Flavobacterium enshiense]
MVSKPKITIVKIGGNVIDDAKALSEVLLAFSNIDGPKILVHGGGKEASKLAEKLGLTPQMIDGRRITDASMLDVVVMTYAGLLNKKIVAQLNTFGTTAIGFTGADGNLILSEKRKKDTVDFGFAGDIVSVNHQLLKTLLENDILPVCCAITHDGNGQLLNTNADTIAGEIAIALTPYYDVELCYCFEKNGVLMNSEDDASVIAILTGEKYDDLSKTGSIHSGMIPKLNNCFEALEKGVKKVVISHHSFIGNKNSIHTIIQL